MLTREDRAEAVRRFVPWDHTGDLPPDDELEARLAAARAEEAAAAKVMHKLVEDIHPEALLRRIEMLEARLKTLEGGR